VELTSTGLRVETNRGNKRTLEEKKVDLLSQASGAGRKENRREDSGMKRGGL